MMSFTKAVGVAFGMWRDRAAPIARRQRHALRCARLESLEPRRMMAGEPTLAPIADVQLRVGSPLHIPLDGFDAQGQTLTYTVTSSNSVVGTNVLQDNRSLRLTVANFGTMVFELFDDRASRATNQIAQLAESGFYDGTIFHRIINGFMIQGGDATGTGSGGSPLGPFDDHFHLDLQHNRSGILSMAKFDDQMVGDDSGDSGFFITETPQRHLDFNHSVFGILVEGEAVREAISNVTTGPGDRPTTDVVIQSADVFVDNENGVLMLKALGSSGTSQITVTVRDTDGKQAVRTFNVTIVPDVDQFGNPINSAPFLADIPKIQTTANTQVTFQLTAFDAEGTPPVFLDENTLAGNGFFVPVVSHPDLDYSVDFETGLVTVTPTNGLVGVHKITVAVAETLGAVDYQVVPIFIAPAAPTAAGVELTLVHSRTTTPANGEVTALPPGRDWIGEWGSFWVEVWVSTPQETRIGVASASVDLQYDTEHLTATAIEYGPAFTENRTGTILDAVGVVDNLGAATKLFDAGDDKRVLLARVRFQQTSEIGLGPAGQYPQSLADVSFRLTDRAVNLTVGQTSLAATSPVNADVWPVSFDLNNDGQIGFADLSIFASSFLKNVGELPQTWKADFDHSGRVDFGDFNLLSTNFLKSRTNSVVIVQPSNFPDAWRSDNLQAESAAVAGLAAEPLAGGDLASIVESAVARLTASWGAERTALLADVAVEIVDLPGDVLGQAGAGAIRIDLDAAGLGWFVDASPYNDLEFQPAGGSGSQTAPAGSPAYNRIDLLTVVMHELAHLAGFDHTSDDDLMHSTLPLGTRRLPFDELQTTMTGFEEFDQFFAALDGRGDEDFLVE